MANSIKMQSLHLNQTSTQANTPVKYAKESGFNISGMQEAEDSNAVDTILNISKEAKLKHKNQMGAGGTVKMAGVTSAREQFEIDWLEQRNYMRGSGGTGYPSGELLEEWMRIDEPETYAKMHALWDQACKYKDNKEEFRKYDYESLAVGADWFFRKCIGSDGWLKNPVTGKRSVVSALEERYSDFVHDTSIDFYDDSFSDNDASLWRFNTRFNVSLPMEMLKDLEMLDHMEDLSDEEKAKAQEQMDKLDTAIANMKQAEIDYEGDLKFLRFGIKFDHDGNVTYHANYTGCEDKYGISADSTEELLKKLMGNECD